MAAKIFSPVDILSIIDLEIAFINRYKNVKDYAKNLSLIYFSLPSTKEYSELFEKFLRQTDVVVRENEHYVVVLHGTNERGASELLSGIQEFLNAEPIDLIVSYPKDGRNAKELTTKLQDEIKDNYGVLLEMLSNQERFEAFESMI
ncbi:pyridoxal-5'-phosphate-dependent protein [Campylobacter concisus]|uniref:pyridoxal-5'-phosphate-dependent protein n=1 Tax=Campylobacter concisus TaxID=199 RepID=UPI000D37239E|nr:pyridoxal-5'-phosphate-dependent protein [Campylobacter concisus]QPH87890.1 pyridoxal-5'-phosphate-dependent protein [Campylobacter concisus]QPI02835.1 pyridoxal-5'-phosphate-dependent protein [Campylobacter concisus]